MGYFKEKIRRLIHGYYYNTDTYTDHLRSLGTKIGKGTIVFSPRNTIIDATRPWLITIGDNVQITDGVKILTHGYDWSVIKGVNGEILGSAGEVVIGDNVFIGTNATILKGTHIGSDVIIGANSLVNKDIPDNCVAAGNPCKVIMSLDEYYEKRKAAQVKEAEELVRTYRARYGKEPDAKALDEFFWLFCDGDSELAPEWKQQMHNLRNDDLSYAALKKNHKKYKDMDEFLKSVK
ncbi:MAG: acyltransferase [Bulleidia sp.]|nr:acyltransferase [Bulleidia sp.]